MDRFNTPNKSLSPISLPQSRSVNYLMSSSPLLSMVRSIHIFTLLNENFFKVKINLLSKMGHEESEAKANENIQTKKL